MIKKTHMLSSVGDAIQQLLDPRGGEAVVLSKHHKSTSLDVLELERTAEQETWRGDTRFSQLLMLAIPVSGVLRVVPSAYKRMETFLRQVRNAPR